MIDARMTEEQNKYWARFREFMRQQDKPVCEDPGDVLRWYFKEWCRMDAETAQNRSKIQNLERICQQLELQLNSLQQRLENKPE